MKYRPLLIAGMGTAFLLAIVIYITYITGVLLPIEDSFYTLLPMSPPLTAYMRFVSFVVDPLPMVVICLSLFLFEWTRKYYALPIALGTGMGTLINMGIKEIIRRPRPEVLQLVEESSYSFPSSHSVAGMVFFMLVLMISRRILKKGWLKNLITALSLLMILSVGISRIYLGVHHLGDVLSGWCLGFIIAGGTYLIYDHYLKKLGK